MHRKVAENSIVSFFYTPLPFSPFVNILYYYGIYETIH